MKVEVQHSYRFCTGQGKEFGNYCRQTVYFWQIYGCLGRPKHKVKPASLSRKDLSTLDVSCLGCLSNYIQPIVVLARWLQRGLPDGIVKLVVEIVGLGLPEIDTPQVDSPSQGEHAPRSHTALQASQGTRSSQDGAGPVSPPLDTCRQGIFRYQFSTISTSW